MFKLKNACKYLAVKDSVGFCFKMKCICRCYNCEYKELCIWLKDCSRLDWRRIDNAKYYYEKASKKLAVTIRNLMKTIPTKEFIGGLLCRREEALLRALTFAQGDIEEALLVQKYLHYEPDLSLSDIRRTDKTTEFCNLLVFQNLLDYDQKRLESQDLLVFATPEGVEYLNKLIENPVDCMKKIFDNMSKIDKKPKEFILEQSILQVWSMKMTEPIRWASLNNVPLEICGIRHDKNVKKIADHMEEMGKVRKKGTEICVDKKRCYDLSYELYNSLLLVSRVIYRESKIVRDLLKILTNSTNFQKLASGKEFYVENWDEVVIEAYMRAMAEYYLLDLEIPEVPHWQLNFQQKSFWGSLTFFAFIIKNRIFLEKLEKELIFKEELRNRLIDRGVRIVKNDIVTPMGDMDFFCNNNSEYFMIEAKDYEPPYQSWYISSDIFEKRKRTIEKQFRIFQKKARWLFSSFGKTLEQPINFLFLTKFTEVPICVEITIDELSSIFGPSKLADRRETLPRITIKNGDVRVEVMGREMHNYLESYEQMLGKYFNPED